MDSVVLPHSVMDYESQLVHGLSVLAQIGHPRRSVSCRCYHSAVWRRNLYSDFWRRIARGTQTKMPKIALEIKMNLENLSHLCPEGADFRWYMKLRCGSCGEAPDHWQYITPEERSDVGGSRGTANLVVKCKICNRQNTLDIVPDSLRKYSAEKNGQFQKVIVFDCRGIEPVAFDPRVGWSAGSSESDSQFSDIDLGEKEWCDYDEKAGVTVGIYEWGSRFVKA